MINLLENSLLMLREKKIPNPELDLRLLLKHASYKNKNEIFLNNFKEEEINLDLFNKILLLRLKNKPISKIIKKKYFWKSEFYVNTHVLDPRPETEIIIEEVLNRSTKSKKNLKILDIGTGSGCIAISLAKELKNAKITAIDISKHAIEVAKKNINLNNCDSQIEIILGNFCQIKDTFDIIVSNPPYLNEKEYQNSQPEIHKFEPKIALYGGKDGLKFYKLFANNIERLMDKNSLFICEIGQNQLNECKDIFKKTNLKIIKISKDIQKIDRTITFLNI